MQKDTYIRRYVYVMCIHLYMHVFIYVCLGVHTHMCTVRIWLASKVAGALGQSCAWRSRGRPSLGIHLHVVLYVSINVGISNKNVNIHAKINTNTNKHTNMYMYMYMYINI